MPLHSQGHMNTMLQFAKRLVWKGAGTIHVTVATTLSTTQKMSNNNLEFISIESIYNDTVNQDRLSNFKARMDEFEAEASLQLSRLISISSSRSKKCLLVYDASMPWALDIAKEHNILAAAFFTQACGFMASVYPLFIQEYPLIAAAAAHNHGHSNYPPLLLDQTVLPSTDDLERGLLNILNLFSKPDQPAASTDTAKKPINPVIKMAISTMNNLHLADYVLFNSFYHLEA